MNIELDLLELNTLYVAISNHIKKTQKDAENYPSDFFETQATLAEMLGEKIQSALYDVSGEIDINFEADDEGETLCVCDDEKTIKELEWELAVLDDELSHYVDKRNWSAANKISDQMEEIEERIEEMRSK
jgi:hypothetical protein